MATNKISLDTGSTLHTGTYVITESALQINIPRSTLNNSSGAEIGINTAPLVVATSGGTIATIGSVTAIAGVVTVTGSTVIISMPAVTGSVSVISLPAITGSVAVINTVAVTGSVVALGGTAGTSGTNVISVQGIASMVPVLVDGSATTQPVSGTVTVTGSTTVVGTVTITGSTTVINTVTVTGSTTVVGTVTITGSTTLVGTSTITGSTTLVHVAFPNRASVVAEVTTAGTTTLIPSHATLCIHLTDLIVSNGAAAGSIKFGETNTTTASNIRIGNLYFAVNGGLTKEFINPIKLSATTPLVMTAVSCTTLSATATYYYAA